jgi:site-specific DNA recombinase
MKAIAYIRVSTNNQEILRQTTKVREFCQITNMTIVDEISDIGKSGATLNRPGYLQLMQITKEMADVIIISELSRLSRTEDIMDTLHSIDILIKKGLKLILLDDPNKTYEGQLNIEELIILSVRAKGAADERIAIKNRNIEGKKALFANNSYAIVDGRIPLGYKKVDNSSSKHPKFLLAEDETDKQLVIKIYELINNGYSLAQVRNYLHDTNVKTKKGDYYTTQALSKIYTNTIYKGVRERNGVISNIKPMIDPEQWESAQQKIKENHQYVSNGTVMFNPLRGLLRCRCGKAMMVKNKGERVYVYRCSETKPAFFDTRCQFMDTIRYDLTNEVLFTLLKSVDFVGYSDKIEERVAELELKSKGLESIINEDRKSIGIIDKELIDLDERYINAGSQRLADIVQQKIVAKEEELSQLKARINKNNTKILQLREQIKSILTFDKSDDFDNLTLEERANLFKKYIKLVQYLPVTTMQGFYKVDFKVGITIHVAVKKTNKSPIFALVPSSFELTDDLMLRYQTYDQTKAKQTFDFGAFAKEEITIKQFFENFDNELLDVNLNYRDKKSTK